MPVTNAPAHHLRGGHDLLSGVAVAQREASTRTFELSGGFALAALLNRARRVELEWGARATGRERRAGAGLR